MQEIRLVTMRLRNFKGIRELDIQFDRKDMKIYGDNGTGKTTIIDSFTWLLFGKDSLGRADFGIKPTNKAGNVIHQLETSVEAVFDISGVERVFKKTLSEVWTRKRGAAEAEFTRNENNFYIDGVPKKKGEYTAAIKELIDEEVFKIITNPLYFNESVNWKDRRSVLLTICGEVSDAEVIDSNPDLAPLVPLLKGKTVADFKDVTAAAMKRVNKELDTIPVKIDEAERAKPSAEALEIDHARKDELTQEIEGLRVQRSNILNGAEVAQKRQELRMAQQELRAVGKNFDPSKTPEEAQIRELERERDKLWRDRAYLQEDCAQWERSITNLKARRASLSTEWDEVAGEVFTGNICPTCHRELPEDEVEAKRRAFNAKKAERLDRIEIDNEDIGEEIRKLEDRLAADREKIAKHSSEIDQLTKKIAQLDAKQEDYVAVKSAEFQKERDRIQGVIASLTDAIQGYENNSASEVAKVDSQIASLTGELNRINEAVANKALLERQDKRIAELRDDQTRLAGEYTRLERGLYLAEQFIIAKVDMLNERINQKFKYAKFKLFDKQINGGINEVCEVTYGGIPYKDLNNAARVNIGLDVINTIAAHYGVMAPILMDNCESVNQLFHTDAQQIRFYVSDDKKLEFKED